MKSNPGGQIDVSQAIGRSKLVDLIWDTVEQQSLIITAERRIGKTTVMQIVAAFPKSGWLPVFQDLERYHSASEFAVAVYREVHQFLGLKGRVARRTKEIFTSLGGTEVGGIFKLPQQSDPHWKDILTQSIEDLVHENDATSTRLLFLWDELPFMLANIRDKTGERVAMELLDVLRALRQTHRGLRMVMTGSIGLHHVLSSLKEKNYANSPVNDMAQIDVPPLEESDAVRLAELLIEGERLVTPDSLAAATAIARGVDCFPFYIHHVVKALRTRELSATPEHVAGVITSQLVDANDPWELLHYRVRIPIYLPRQPACRLSRARRTGKRARASIGESAARHAQRRDHVRRSREAPQSPHADGA